MALTVFPTTQRRYLICPRAPPWQIGRLSGIIPRTHPNSTRRPTLCALVLFQHLRSSMLREFLTVFCLSPSPRRGLSGVHRIRSTKLRNRRTAMLRKAELTPTFARRKRSVARLRSLSRPRHDSARAIERVNRTASSARWRCASFTRLSMFTAAFAVLAGHAYADCQNPRSFGAVGDGRHDDTEALQASIRAVVNVSFRGGLVCLPA